MVGTEERKATQDARDPARERNQYSPGYIGYWLDHWLELKELAVPTAPAIRYDKLNTQVPVGFRRSDPMHYMDLMVDIERAWVQLGHRWSLAFQIVEWCMQGYDLVTIADQLRVSVDVASDTFDAVCARMARLLGWGRQTDVANPAKE